MKRLAFLLLISAAFAQSKPADPSSVPLQLIHSTEASTLTLSTAELTVPAHATKERRFTGTAAVTIEGWITSIVDVSLHGHDRQDSLTPHAQVVNISREDLLCKGRDEIIGQSEGPRWPPLDEYGYHVRPGDRLGIILSFENSSDLPIQLQYVEVAVKFQAINEAPFRRDAYPMWFNARGCGPAEFDLKPGKNISSGSFEIPLDGLLVALQGSLREHAEYLNVENRSREKTFLHQVAVEQQALPLVTPPHGEEFRVDRGDFVAIAAGYNNAGKTEAKNAGTGVALGLFVPIDESKMALLTKSTEKPSAKTTAAAAEK